MNPFSQALDVPPPSSSSNNQQQQHQHQQQSYYQGAAGTVPPQQPRYPQQHHQGQQQFAAATAFQPNNDNMMSHHHQPPPRQSLEYVIMGNEMQLVEFDLSPGQTVVAEAGAMMYMENFIEFKTKLGDGTEPKQGFFQKLAAAGGRWLTGESLFLTHFTNRGPQNACVGFAAPYPGTIVAVDLAAQRNGGSVICQKDAFLCAALGTKVSVHFHKRLGAGLFGGEGFVLQKLQGNSLAFIHAGGTVIEKELNGDTIRLDTGCLVAFTDGINYDIQLVKGLTSIIFGNEGLFLATLSGHGTVWMQSLPFSRMADRIIRASGRNQGEGTALNPLGGILGGDQQTGFGLSI